MNILETFKTDVFAFIEDVGISPTAFGDNAINDPNFVGDLKNGRAPSATTMQRVYDFIKRQSEAA